MRALAPFVLAAVAAAGLAGSSGTLAAQRPPSKIPVYGYTVVKSYPHDRGAFTQGLQYVDGVLYESTGLHGQSSIRKVNLETGAVLQRREISQEYFGEGITIFKGDLFQLTWQSGKGFVYDRATFAPKKSFSYRGEGWGLTHDQASLIMSDGTEYLRYLDPSTLAEKRRVRVTGAGQPIKQLNELEYVKGEVFANVWQTNYIVRIDPATGRAASYVDFKGLLAPSESAGVDVMNGIAYDAAGDRLFVTGKLWPRLFEVRITQGR